MRDNCTLVIFGSTGNLAQIKLLPALYHLEVAGYLSPSMRVMGFGRRDWSDAHWRDEVRDWVKQSARGALDEPALQRLQERFYFVEGDLTDGAGFERLAQRLRGDEGFARNLIFYLAIAPGQYGSAVDGLAAQGLNQQDDGWARLVVEKPFGYDLESAEILDQQLRRHFDED